jgi:hypothetical protein
MILKRKIRLLWQRKIKDNLKIFRRTVRTALKSPSLAMDFHKFRYAIASYDWDSAQSMVKGIAERALSVKDPRLLREMSNASLRFLDIKGYTLWESESEILNKHTRFTDWTGESLLDSTLWISFKETEKQGIAVGMNLVGYVRYAAKNAKHTVLVVDERLVNIFSRTLPEIEVLSGTVNPIAKQHTRLVTANSLILRLIIGVELSTLSKLYVPLIPDKKTANKLSLKYNKKSSRRALFGIAWGSFSSIKEEAPLELWVDLIKSIDAIFVVTQYKYEGISIDLEMIVKAAPGRVIIDKEVDQIVDMDTFAAQLSSLDALISTTSSDAHYAGSLGVSTFLTSDDLFRRSSPVRERSSLPWYPNAIVYAKSGRQWPAVFDDIKEDLVRKYGCSIIN